MSNPIISLNHVAFAYNKQPVLRDINLTIQPGEIIGLVGPNGAGKTTLLNLIQGILPHAAGITVFGGQPGNPTAKAATGSMLQGNLKLPRVHVAELISLIGDQYTHPLPTSEVLALTNLTAQANQNVATLSGGQLRRVTFACAIVHQPQLLFLDEPTVGMDALARQEFWDLISRMRARHVTIIITSHYLEEIQHVADRIAILRQGRFAYVGRWDQLQAAYNGGQISFTTPLPPATFSHLPGVTQVAATADHLTLTSQDTDLTVQALVPFFPDLHHFTATRQSLETIYLDLVKEDDKNEEVSQPTAV
jgi:ABC-2 type transport system ATP-binding protein